MTFRTITAAAVLTAFAGAASAQWVADPAFNSKTEAQEIFVAAGSTITGNSTGTANGTYFLVNVEPAPLAIYRHRFLFESETLNQRGWIKGLNQNTSGQIQPGTDALVQATNANTDPSIFNQWYGFGKGEQFFYQVFGTAATTADYTITMETELVTPQNLGVYQPGQLAITTIDQGHNTSTHIHVYDENLQPIPGFQNIRPDNSTFQSFLERDYNAGTYYLAIGLRNLANDQATPDDSIQRNQPVMDFPNILVGGQPGTPDADYSFAIIQDGVEFAFDAQRQGAYDVFWGTFTVIPAPSAAGVLALAGLAAARRRR